MTQVEDEDDLQSWAEKPEEEVLGKNDPCSIAADALERLAEILGEKSVLACASGIIFQAVNNKDIWQ